MKWSEIVCEKRVNLEKQGEKRVNAPEQGEKGGKTEKTSENKDD